MHGYDVATWRTFFLATIGTAATLTGLLFVSVSINLDRILTGSKFLPARARETLASLVLIVAYSSLTHARPELE
jgi:modulator of FtsH protease